MFFKQLCKQLPQDISVRIFNILDKKLYRRLYMAGHNNVRVTVLLISYFTAFVFQTHLAGV